MLTKTKKSTTTTAVPASSVQPKPLPQIPTMLAALRREREKARSLLAALEVRLAPVMRAADEIRTGSASAAVTAGARWDSTAPIAETLDESVGTFAALNGKIKELTSRLEI